jgi:hypothetical protein
VSGQRFIKNVYSSVLIRVVIALSLLMFITANAHATELVLSQPLTGDVVAYNHQSFLVAGLSNKQPQLSVIVITEENQLIEKENYQLKKNYYQGFASAYLAINDNNQAQTTPKEHIVLFGTEGIYLAKEEGATLLIEQPSLFRVIDNKKFSHLPLVYDVNVDGLSDFILPDFHQYWVFVQNEQGEFAQSKLAYSSTVNFQSSTFDDTSVQFVLPKQIKLFDVNNDGDLDIVFASKHTVQYFLQDKKGNFDKQPKKMALPIELSAPESTVESYSHTTRYAFNRFDDINTDGVQDIVIEKKTYEKDISDGIQQVLVLFGQYNSNKQLSFELKRSTSITHKGELIDYGFADFNGDALKDLYFLGADLGASSVLSALWAGSFTVDINIYTLDRKKGFSKKPDVSKETEFIVDMNQIVFGAIVHIADINGDKRSDLLLQSDANELAIYSGNSKKVLTKRSQKILLDLPSDPNLISIVKLKQDDEHKVLIRQPLKNSQVKFTLVNR